MAQRLSPKLIIPIAALFAGLVLVLSALSGSTDAPPEALRGSPTSEQAIFRITSTPGGCEIRYDDALVGKTPMKLVRDRDARLHALELSCEGFLPHREDVLAEGERTVDVFLAPVSDETAPRRPVEVIRLHVESEPAGRLVRWDGREVGRTPLDFEVPRGEGTHELGVFDPSLAPQIVKVVPNRDQAFSLTLRPPERTGNGRIAKVVIFSTPTGARVRFDGEDVGETPAVFQRVADDAEHEIEVSLGGYPPVKLKRVLSSDLFERVEFAAR